MSYPDHPPPHNFMPLPFPAGNVGGFWPQNTSEHSGSQSRFDNAPPFKRPRNYDNHPPNSVPYPPMNPRPSQPNPPVNIGTRNIFFKTRMCVKFLDNNCRNGENCTFAHGLQDMRDPPPNWQEIVREKDMGDGNWNDDQRIIQRMKICRKFYNGEKCPYGEKCNFLHESPAKFKSNIVSPLRRENSALSIGTNGPFMEYRSDDQAEQNKHLSAGSDVFRVNMNWKTKICSRWEITGQCPFGERCHSAHGQSDLLAPSGDVEAEAVMSFATIPMKVLPHPTETEAAGGPTKEAENTKSLSRWKIHKKINCIYGDWPEDLIPPEN